MNDISGHCDREKRIILVKKKFKKRQWTNQTSILIEKYCKKHNKMCFFTEKSTKCKLSRREEYINYKKKNYSNTDIKCIKCNIVKTFENFYKNPSNKKGRANICKECKKEYDRKRNNTWPVLIRAAYRQSINAHGNKEGINKISLEECKTLLEKQNYKCKHCRFELSCIQVTVIDCNYYRASLDRIDTTIVGYKNNSQWLCVSCNKGKCTMPDEEHKKKFSKLFDRINYLENILKDNNISYN